MRVRGQQIRTLNISVTADSRHEDGVYIFAKARDVLDVLKLLRQLLGTSRLKRSRSHSLAEDWGKTICKEKGHAFLYQNTDEAVCLSVLFKA